MTDLVIRRTYLELATTGLLDVAGKPFRSIEPPKEGVITCLPEGVYTMEPYFSQAHGFTWTLRNDVLGIVGQQEAGPGEHNFCEMHTGNWATDSKKCVIVGTESHPMTNPKTGLFEPAVENSKTAMMEILAILGRMSTGHTITIGQA